MKDNKWFLDQSQLACDMTWPKKSKIVYDPQAQEFWKMELLDNYLLNSTTPQPPQYS